VVNGNPSDVGIFLFDGIQSVDADANVLLFYPPVDAMQEFKVQTGDDTFKHLFHRYADHGLILQKKSTPKAISAFICVRIDEGTGKQEHNDQLVELIRKEISDNEEFLFLEIDSASAVICDLMVRARVRHYFAISTRIKWLSDQPHVRGTETYLSLTSRPLTGDQESGENEKFAYERV
jgi:hypothetical protein